MGETKTARGLAVVFIGVLSGIYRHFDNMRWIGRGREAFLAMQGHRFDRMEQNHGALVVIVANMVLVGIGIGVYEAIVAGFLRVLPPRTEV